MHHDPIILTDPPERPELEPFASAFVQIIVPEAVTGGWFEAHQKPPDATLAKISRRLDVFFEQRIRNRIHPALYVHALLVCSSFFSTATDALEDFTEQDHQSSILDAAFSLVQHLLLHHDLYGLYVRLS